MLLPRSFFISLFLVAAVACFLFAAPAAAQNEYIVVDVDGITRASAIVDGRAAMEFQLLDEKGQPVDGIVVNLTNTANGQVLSRTVINGKVVFADLTPGIWEVSSPATWVVFADIRILSSTAARAAGLGAIRGSQLAAGALTLGGLAVGAYQIADGGSSSSPEPTPLPTLDPTPTPAPTVAPTPRPGGGGGSRPTPTPIEPSPFR